MTRIINSRGQWADFDLSALAPGRPRPRVAPVAEAEDRGFPIRGRDGLEVGRYSLTRALGALAEDRNPTGIEAEIGAELGRVDDFREYRGLPVPFGVFGAAARALDTTTGAGARLDVTDASAWVEGLRNASVIAGFGARVVTGIRGATLAYPKLTTNSSVGWIGEGSNAPEAPTEFTGQLVMQPHTTGAYVDVTRSLVKQAGPLLMPMVAADLRAALAAAIDAAALAGPVATPQLSPVGVFNTAGVPSVAVGGALSGAKLAELEDAIGEDRTVTGFATSKAVRRAARNAARLAGGSVPLWGDDNRVLGYPARATSNAPAGKAVLGAWPDCLVGFWGNGVDVLIDPFTNGSIGSVRIVALVDVDVAFRHLESFAVATGIS